MTTKPIFIRLSGGPAAQSFKVTDAETGRPIAGVTKVTFEVGTPPHSDGVTRATLHIVGPIVDNVEALFARTEG